MAKHTGDHPASCPSCITKAHRESLFGRDWISHMALHDEQFRRDHARALKARAARQRRDSARRDLGLVKARGALAGTYWE